MKIILFLFSLLYGMTLNSSDAATSSPLPPELKLFKIFMVLWNGKTDLEKGFTTYLKEKNVDFEVEIRDCQGDRAKCHALVPEIRAYKPDLIYTWGTPACEEIAGKLGSSPEKYIWNIPFVSLIVTDPINSKLIKNLEKPGRNVTGVNHVAPLDVQLNSILAYKKDTKIIAAIYNPDETNSVNEVKAFTQEAKKSSITVLDMPVLIGKDKKPDPSSIPGIVKTAYSHGVDFIYTPPDTFMSVNCAAFVEAANRYKIPTFATTDSMYWKGKPLLGMLSRFINVGRFGGLKAYQILIEGRKPQDIPYEKLSRFSYIVSLDTARSINLEPPIPVLRYAEIIEEKIPRTEVA